MKGQARVLVSACLAGVSCRYDGGHCLDESIRALVRAGQAIPVCPEQLGGLPTPRIPSEIVAGKGLTARVINQQGDDVSWHFVEGAKRALEAAREEEVLFAVLKSHSPSCGVDGIYDGSFAGILKPGEGVTASLLREAGIDVISSDAWRSASSSWEGPGSGPAG